MAIMFRTASALFFLILSVFPALAQTPEWIQGLHSRVRILSGGQEDDRYLAAVEIALDPGFKTYWRNPGESGLPPRFDWSGSGNVADIEIRWPAPGRYEDVGGISYGYSHKVVLPLLIKAKEPGKPVNLALTLDYGICKDICIPTHAEMKTVLAGDSRDRAILEKAMAAVPRPQALNAPGDLSVLSVEPAVQGRSEFIVTVRVPPGLQASLFAEGPENWYLSSSHPADGNRFTVTIEEKPKDATGLVPLRLTLVAGDLSVETELSLDAAQLPR